MLFYTQAGLINRSPLTLDLDYTAGPKQSHASAMPPCKYIAMPTREQPQGRTYYMLESSSNDVLNRIWDWVQSTHDELIMYKTRVSSSTTAWIIECPTNKMQSFFLLQFSRYVSEISRPTYYDRDLD